MKVEKSTIYLMIVTRQRSCKKQTDTLTMNEMTVLKEIKLRHFVFLKISASLFVANCQTAQVDTQTEIAKILLHNY